MERLAAKRLRVAIKNMADNKAHITMQSRIIPKLIAPPKYASRNTNHIDITCPSAIAKKTRSSAEKRMSNRKEMESPSRQLTTMKKNHSSMDGLFVFSAFKDLL
jgi:hypothetical protein